MYTSSRPPAESAGTPNLLYRLEPRLASINMGPFGNVAAADLYNGAWYSSPVPDPTWYSERADSTCPKGFLVMSNPGNTPDHGPYLCTTSTHSTTGNVPSFTAGQGFYHRTRARVSRAQPSNWFCGWSEPIEHDKLNTAPMWLEWDGHEGGAGTGKGQGIHMWGAAVIWRGVSSKNVVPNQYIDLLHDPSMWHDYSYWWTPAGVMSWSIDGVLVGSVDVSTQTTAAELAAINATHPYQIFDAQSSGANLPYELHIDSTEVWVGS